MLLYLDFEGAKNIHVFKVLTSSAQLSQSSKRLSLAEIRSVEQLSLAEIRLHLVLFMVLVLVLLLIWILILYMFKFLDQFTFVKDDSRD